MEAKIEKGRALVLAGQHGLAAALRSHQHQEPKRVCSPNFIFCTSDPEPLKHLEGRRFHIVRMGTAG